MYFMDYIPQNQANLWIIFHKIKKGRYKSEF